MKKVATFVVSVLVAGAAWAQTMQDAITFTEHNYYGTARSIAIGNAVTALGGDTGMFGINPAGSAVSNYSQATISPGLSINTSSSTFTPNQGGREGAPESCSTTKFIVPNGGLILRFDTGREYGIRNFSFGLAANTTSKHLNYVTAGGRNSQSSIYGAFAAQANAEGMDPDVFSHKSDPWFDSSHRYSWNPLSAYGANMIGYMDSRGRYVGTTQTLEGELPGEISQRSSREWYGSESDIEINFGLNVEDKFYAGINLGVPIQRYSYNESFNEAAIDFTKFPVTLADDRRTYNTYWDAAQYRWSYASNVDGVYGKIGFIWLPLKWLRVGAAIKTPTAYTITERWSNRVTSRFEESAVNASSGPSVSGEYRYNLRSPYEVNAGLAVTFGTVGLFSVDYEMNDHSIMQYRELHQRGNGPGTYFYEINSGMKNFAGVSHALRVGLEFNIGNNFAVRGGFNMLTSPVRHYNDNFGNDVYVEDYLADFEAFDSGLRVLDKSSRRYIDQTRLGYSFGLGYRSNGSFFADIAARCTKYPVSTFYCYSDYGTSLEYTAPEIKTSRSLWDVVLTLGWRF